MNSVPTRGAVDQNQNGWVSRPGVARAIRILLFLTPMIVGWFAVRVAKDSFWQPVGTIGVVIWVVQAMIVAGATSYVAVNWARRLAPLSTMFQMTLVFPDHAPSRLGVALRAGTVKKLAATTDLSGKSDQVAAEHAVALIARLGKHERLTRGHTERVRARAELIGAEMGLSDDELQKLRWGVLLHDIGKLKVPADILSKEAKLTSEEWAILREHPAEGARIVEPLRGWLGDWVDAAGQHHERWDGDGYPAGLAGTEISAAGRITAVADAYDVITSKRSYKEAMSDEAARKELVRCSGGQFDPAVVRAALEVGLRETNRAGLAGWVLELPSVARFAAAVPAVVAAAATATIVTAASLSGPIETSDAPVALAFSQSEFEEIIENLEEETAAAEAPFASAPGPAADEAPSSPVTDLAVGDPTSDVTPSTTTDALGAATGSDASGQGPDTVLSTTTDTLGAATDSAAGDVGSPPSTGSASLDEVQPNRESETSNATVGTIDRVSVPTTSSTAAPTNSSTSTTTTVFAPTAPSKSITAPTTSTTSTTTTTTSTTTTTTTAAPRPALPTGSGIVVLAGDDVPNDLSDNTLTSNTITYVIEEKQSVRLAATLPVVRFADGVEARADQGSPATISAGTVVCSWLVRLEPVEGSSTTVMPMIDFNATILGFATEVGGTEPTNVLAIDGVNYAAGGVGSSDFIEPTGSVVSLEMSSGGLDQWRVITSCGNG